MTRARVTAQQLTRPPKSARLVRGVVSAVSPLTVQIAGGAAVGGIPIPGATYTVGGAVLVLTQEPGIGPVYPIPGSASLPDLSSTAPTPITYSGTFANFGGTRVTLLSKYGPLATLNLQCTVGATAPGNGTLVGTIPAGFRPTAGSVNWKATLYNGAFNGHSVDLDLGNDGRLFYQAGTIAPPVNSAFFGTVTYPAA